MIKGETYVLYVHAGPPYASRKFAVNCSYYYSFVI